MMYIGMDSHVEREAGSGRRASPAGATKTAERRENNRFPVQEEVRYRLLNPKSLEASGTGITLNISSRGILFTTEGSLPIGRLIELSVNWPARLDNSCPLKFVAVGRVVRSETSKAAVRIERYEFKTRRQSSR